jgi:putative hydrolase of the HAD superfamily
MIHIKHFSFDLWYTLIKSNPTFKKERALYFHKKFNAKQKSLEEVELVFRKVDLMCNAINEKTGQNIDSEEMYLMVIYELNNSFVELGPIDLAFLYTEMEYLFFQYAPVLFNEETHSCLTEIKQKGDVTLSLLSNTAFIKGVSLRKVVDHLGISNLFDFQIYSDEVGVSKPNAAIYQIMVDNINNIWNGKEININEIIHVGDNPVADIKGAQDFGVRAFQINTNDLLISNLLTHAN